MKRPLFFTVCLLAVLAAGRAQCPDFTNLTGPGVACWADNDVPSTNHGPIPGRYEVITQQGMDPYTGYQLPILPPGENTVVKLGNDLGGHQTEVIDYNFVVDPEYAVVTVKFAFVIQNFGNMTPQQCPTFSVFFLQPANDNPLESESVYPCGVYAFNDLEYRVDGLHVSGNVIWSQWTTINVDLSEYAGQTVRVRFLTHDGAAGNSASFCYAYFTATCMSDSLSVVGCDGGHVTLAAPDGYANYLWNNGSTTSTSTYTLQDNLDVSCHVASDLGLGCNLTFNINSIEGVTMINGETWYDTICQGDSYSGHGFDLSPQQTPGVFTFSRTVLDSANCLSGTLYKLRLTVLQRNVYYYETACEGMDFDQYGFHYTNLQAGTIRDSLPLTTENGCTPAYKHLQLTVIPSLANSGELFGDTYVCDGTANTYTLIFPEPIFQYQWNIPDGVTNYTNDHGASVLLNFTEDAPNPAIISVTGNNVCGSHTMTKTVFHSPSYHLVYVDTACTGEQYDGYGIQTPVLDDPGLHYLSLNGTTVNGCDSNVMVRLVVSPTPTVTTLAQPEVVCAGDNATIHALGENASFNLVPEPLTIVPGDILCTDMTIAKPTFWPVPGKTARGVIFFVDTTGQHGWAVNLTDQGTHCRWGILDNLSGEPPSLYDYTRAALMDLNGYANTYFLRINASEWQPNVPIGIFAEVDFDNGWYIPALGQLRILYEEKHVVNAALQAVGGTTLFNTTNDWYTTVTKYWSSTLKILTGSTSLDHPTAWLINSSGQIQSLISSHYPSSGVSALPGCRSICNF